MIIMGIDPGIATMGFGIISSQNNKLEHIRHGVVTTKAGVPLHYRLLTVYEDLSELISVYKPDEAAVEELFFGKNTKTAIPVSHARGVILLACAKSGIPVAEYKPSQIKQAVVGFGNAEKQQIMQMTTHILNLPRIPRPDDAADALAIAITHANQRRF